MAKIARNNNLYIFLTSLFVNDKLFYWNDFMIFKSMRTNAKINIFGTHPVSSANFNRNKQSQRFLSMTVSTHIIIYFYSKIKTV